MAGLFLDLLCLFSFFHSILSLCLMKWWWSRQTWCVCEWSACPTSQTHSTWSTMLCPSAAIWLATNRWRATYPAFRRWWPMRFPVRPWEISRCFERNLFVTCLSSRTQRRFNLDCSSFSASAVGGKGNDPEAAGNPTYRTGPESLSPQLRWRSHCRLWAAAASAEGVWSGRRSNWTTAG